MTTVLILPGIGDSPPLHWQSLWEASSPTFQRVRQRDWDKPQRNEWVNALDMALRDSDTAPILVAHSLACLVVVHWALHGSHPIKGAMLVAPPDPDHLNFPIRATGFAPVPLTRLAFPSVVIASSNDPYGSLDYARRCATAWGSRFIDIGDCGHINADSGLGTWPEGMAQLQSMLKQAEGVQLS
jgi:predicted alpha/beta hydrolase family esterase